MADRIKTQCFRHAGFTLVELAIVVALMSILLTLGIGAMTVQMDNAAIGATQKKQEIIKEALIAYLRTYRRLPCPETTGLAGTSAAPTGREIRSTPGDPASLCASYFGTLPWLDLGLPKDVAMDGHGNFFAYYVSSAQATTEPDWTLTPVGATVPGFNVGNFGRFAIVESGQNTTVDAANNPVPALFAAVVLVSHGKNGFGAVTEKGTRNSPPTDVCESANRPADAGAQPSIVWPDAFPKLHSGVAHAGCPDFDDLVLVLRPNDLLGPIIKDGAMKSAPAQLADTFSRIKTALAAAVLADPNHRLPGGLPATDAVDPWGRPLRYDRLFTAGLTQTSPSSGDAYTLTSDGPDRTPSTTDDVVVNVSLVELCQLVGIANLPP